MAIKKLKSSSKKTGHCQLAISGDFTVAEVPLIHNGLVGYFGDYTNIFCDLSAIEEIDSCGIQLLLALDRRLKNKGKSLLLKSDSPAVSEAMAMLSVTDQFNWGSPD